MDKETILENIEAKVFFATQPGEKVRQIWSSCEISVFSPSIYVT